MNLFVSEVNQSANQTFIQIKRYLCIFPNLNTKFPEGFTTFEVIKDSVAIFISHFDSSASYSKV